MFKSIFGGIFGDAAAKVKKVENKDVMEAILGGGLLLAYADGEKEDAEVQKLEQLVRANPNLSHFGQEITAAINKFTGLLDADYQVGRLQIMKEIADLKNRPEQAAEAFVNMLAVAKADGQVEDAELVELKAISRTLGINPADFGIQL